MPNARIRASVKPVPILSAQVRAVQPIARATVAYTKPRMAAYLDEYARNPFRYDEITPSDALFALATIKVLSDSEYLLDAYTADVGKVLSDQTFYSELLHFALLFERTFADSVATLEASTREFGVNKADAQALSDAVTKFVGKVLDDAPAVLDAQTKALAKPFSDPVFQAEVLEFSIAFTREFADALEATDADVAFSFAAPKQDEVTIPDGFAAAFSKLLSDEQLFADTLAKAVATPFSDSTFYGEVIQFASDFFRTFTESAVATDVLNKFDLAPAYFDSPIITEQKAVAFETSFSDSFSIVDLFGLLHVRDFFDEVHTAGYGSTFAGSALNTALMNAMLGGDTVTLGVQPAKTESLAASDEFIDVVDFQRAPTDSVSETDALFVGFGNVEADTATITDSQTLANTFARAQNDANIVAETYMLIETVSTQTVPATLDRSTFNALPFNKEGSYTTNSTVQVV